MSFYNDLKKPYTPPPSSPSGPKPIISEENRTTIAESICTQFKEACLEASKNNKRSVKEQYSWVDQNRYRHAFSLSDYYGRDDYYIAVDAESMSKVPLELYEKYPSYLNIWSNTCKLSKVPNLPHMSYNECHRILVLVNALLVKDGFPSNVATIKEIKIKTPGPFFSQASSSVYCLELNTFW